ncbi:hypothetical protein QZR14_00325 [Pseudomonas sp. rhizo66]|uniref:hypothetical protein n=1 Tax=Pseudomonas sp. rhizo66 TaxID=3059674 RepID=UPI00288E21CE|nr:hypothetical protein [Pseudomonas sp. rhizo66]MDT3309789.1 hypothetical protein [Pseudomonas sp. rhizo66]
MDNYIKNGDFSEEGAHWEANNPDNVTFENNTCVIAGPAKINQYVDLLGRGDPGYPIFMFSLRVRTPRSSPARITLTFEPIRNPLILNIDSGDDWVDIRQEFTRRSVFDVSVTLESLGSADEGKCFFDDVKLSILPDAS